ncbi:MAG: hypothetical protein ACLVIW_10795, partial [Bilophila wadsworthia]
GKPQVPGRLLHRPYRLLPKKATTIPTVASRNTSPATTTDVTPAMIHLKKSGMGEYSNRLR